MRLKKLKTLPKKIRLIVSFFGAVFFLGFIFCFILNNQVQINSTLLTANVGSFYTQGEVKINLSERLKIPSIKVDTVIESVGLTSEGAVDVPKGPSDAAWFNLGPRPGEKGSSIIVGHSGWKNGRPAVFDNLYKLKIGDKIYIQDEKGLIITFVVREIKTYNQTEDVSNVFISNDNKAHLNLITCTGIWDDIQKGRLNRLIIFTDKE
jgi:LPXTG-site transpeptidase (sortase) family protein